MKFIKFHPFGANPVAPYKRVTDTPVIDWHPTRVDSYGCGRLESPASHCRSLCGRLRWTANGQRPPWLELPVNDCGRLESPAPFEAWIPAFDGGSLLLRRGFLILRCGFFAYQLEASAYHLLIICLPFAYHLLTNCLSFAYHLLTICLSFAYHLLTFA